MEIKFTFLVLTQKVSLHELSLSPQPILDVPKKRRNLRKVFEEFLNVRRMAPESSDGFVNHLFASPIKLKNVNNISKFFSDDRSIKVIVKEF